MSAPERTGSPIDQGIDADPKDMPEPTEEHFAKVEEIDKAYDERPTSVLPGSGGTISGTAVSEWLDDEGNPIYGRDDESGQLHDR